MSVIRGTSLRGYPEVVTELGGDPNALLTSAGIRPDDVGDFDAFFTYLSLIHAVESAARTTRTPDFGRRLAQRQGIEMFGPVGVAARTAESVAGAIDIFESYLGAYSPSNSVTVDPGDETSFLEFKILIPYPPACPQTIELALGVMLRVLRFLLGSDYAPTAVHIPHTPLAPQEEYRRYFACAPTLSSARVGITVLAEDLRRPLVHDEMAHGVVLDYLDTVVDRHRPTMSSSIRPLIRQLLPTGSAAVPLVAEQFRLHPKTLRRRLVAEGTTFNAVVDDVRREMAEHYLRDPDITLSHLARELGYAEQSVLSRSCQRWFGSSPGTLREEWGGGRRSRPGRKLSRDADYQP
ncbi:AraC family transcriptional regulator [Gordonia sp. LSe1-13]|uniref:AraC family transcriptional regulator n=1 Tax=Gordonia sesuvii TaxID=3116777 RepID=A0ABU7MK27_9ACTN|nr:AraC family transcriptional regulator [Gordonia sp. LSe1-13]